ncbi:MAG: hypothetical protein RIT81_25870 [Deltaproteobacteria bacterium]
MPEALKELVDLDAALLLLGFPFFFTTVFSMFDAPVRRLRNLGILGSYAALVGGVVVLDTKSVLVAWAFLGAGCGLAYFAYELVGGSPRVMTLVHGLMAWPIMGPEVIEYVLADLGVFSGGGQYAWASVDELFAALDEGLRGEELDPNIVQALCNKREDREQILDRLDAPIRAYPPHRVSLLALGAGALVEQGADARRFPPAVFEALAKMLETIDGPGDERELPESFVAMEQAAVACFAQSAEVRAHFSERVRLRECLRRYDERYGFLGKMVQVLDGESIVVVHVPSRVGVRFVMTGIADNFQLHTLLLGALAGSRVPGPSPSPGAVAAAGDGPVAKRTVTSRWQLVQWSGLREGGVAGPDDTDSWIWNEGVPADIAPFDGERVVLISDGTIERSWNATRTFPAMAGQLEEKETLSAAEVDALLAAIEARVAS